MYYNLFRYWMWFTMAEAASTNASSTLYRYLCTNIVGTEDHVRTIRMMNNARDNLASDNNFEVITSGSFGEGLEMRGSDLDIMSIHKKYEVSESDDFDFKRDTTFITMSTDDTQSGFTLLRLAHHNRLNYFIIITDDWLQIGDDFYFSSATFKQKSPPNIILPNIHGPCVSDKEGLFDVAVCLHSKSWVTPACQWMTRSKRCWPTYEVKQSIVDHGVIFVPIGVKGSTKEHLEWRMSFSVGEKFLVYSFTHTQLLCYALMKILLKDVIAIDSGCEDLLCSYFMKTILFWISEELPTSIWVPENMISCFMRYFRRLIYCVKYSVCPHYFIADNNLFENKIKGKAQTILLKQLYNLYSYGWQCIMFSDQIPTFSKLGSHIFSDPSDLHVDSVIRFLHSDVHVTDFVLPVTLGRFEKGISKILSTKNLKMKHLYLFYVSKICHKKYQFPRFKDIYCNKSSYKHYNNCVSNILLCLHHDAVSGWLKLASLFYQTKQYNRALVIIQYCLMKCTPEKLNLYYLNFQNVHYEILNMAIFKKMTIVQLWKYLLLDIAVLFSDSTVTPDEIQIQGNESSHVMPPKVYALFLCFLCHYRLNNKTACRDCIRDLHLNIHENNKDKPEYDHSMTILGIAFQLVGDIESARQAFMQSIEIIPDHIVNTSFERLSSIDQISL